MRTQKSDLSRSQMPAQRPGEPLRTQRSELALAAQQLEAVDSWHRARAKQEAIAVGSRTREARMDLARRMEVLRRQQDAIIRRSQEQLQASGRLIHNAAPTRAVIVHRNEWFQGKITEGLRELGIEVVAQLDNGADAVGTVVAEQPDLLLVEDNLPMQPGPDVIRLSRLYSPETIIAGHVAYDDRVAIMLEAGAAAAYTRRVPPVEVAEALGHLLEA
jgi:CheY-like chemotaxis protein